MIENLNCRLYWPLHARDAVAMLGSSMHAKVRKRTDDSSGYLRSTSTILASSSSSSLPPKSDATSGASSDLTLLKL